MVFQPDTNQELVIGGTSYRIAEHPSAPRMPYGQEGRTALVYQLVGSIENRALKVFKPRYRLPGLVSLSRRLAPFAGLPGLRVCHRTVLTPQQDNSLLSEHPDLLYAIDMPWIEGPSWMEVVLYKHPLTQQESLTIARAFAGMLAGMEQESLAHCDLSGPNLLLPMLAGTIGPISHASQAQNPVELVDVEQMYGPELRRPDFLPAGSSGYAHNTAHEGVWSADADRFPGALLLGEILGWCDERVRDASWSESYFDPDEMQKMTESYDVLVTALRERWGDGVAGLFERAWRSGTPAECPTFGEWLMRLPQPASIPTGSELQAASHRSAATPSATSDSTDPNARIGVLLEQAERFENAGDFTNALIAYREAQSIASPNSGLMQELDLIMERLAGRHTEGARDLGTPGLTPGTLASQIAAAAVATPEPEPLTSTPSPQVEAAEPAAPPWLTPGTLPTETTITPQPEGDPLYSSTGVAVSEPVSAGAGMAGVDVPPGPPPPVISPVPTPITPPSSVQPKRRSPLVVLLPGLLLLGLLVIGGAVWFLSDSAAKQSAISQATATAVGQVTATAVAQIDATSTVQALAANATVQAVETATAEAQAATETSIASETESAIAAQTHVVETAQAGVVATAEARVKEAVAAAQESIGAVPVSPNVITIDKRDQIRTIRTLQGHTETVNNVAFSPDSQMLATVAGDSASVGGNVWLWKVSDGSVLHRLAVQSTANNVAFSPDNRTLAIATNRGVEIWDAVDGLRLRSIGSDVVYGLAFSPDGLNVATGEYNGEVRLWRVVDGALLLTMAGKHSDYINDLAYSPDGSILASASGDMTVRLWNASDGALLRTLTGHTNQVRALAFAPDGQSIVTTSGDDTIRQWRVSDGVQLSIVSEVPSSGIAFSPNGEIGAIGGTWEMIIHLVRVSDGAELPILEGHTGAVENLAFSPDGTLLASASGDMTVRLWGVAEGP